MPGNVDEQTINTLPTSSLSFDGTVIREETDVKLLGVTFDRKLMFLSHLYQVAVRASQRLGFFRKVCPVLDRNGRLSIYKGFIRPTMEYTPLVWPGAVLNLQLREACPATVHAQHWRWDHAPKLISASASLGTVLPVQAALHFRSGPSDSHAATCCP